MARESATGARAAATDVASAAPAAPRALCAPSGGSEQSERGGPSVRARPPEGHYAHPRGAATAITSEASVGAHCKRFLWKRPAFMMTDRCSPCPVKSSSFLIGSPVATQELGEPPGANNPRVSFLPKRLR